MAFLLTVARATRTTVLRRAGTVGTATRCFSDIPAQMRAVVVNETGPAEVLTYVEDHPVPSTADGQVLVRNEFAGINFIDTYHRGGLYPRELPFIGGQEGGGRIVATTPAAEAAGFSVGDAVAYSVFGAYAEYSVRLVTLHVKCGRSASAVVWLWLVGGASHEVRRWLWTMLCVLALLHCVIARACACVRARKRVAGCSEYQANARSRQRVDGSGGVLPSAGTDCPLPHPRRARRVDQTGRVDVGACGRRWYLPVGRSGPSATQSVHSPSHASAKHATARLPVCLSA